MKKMLTFGARGFVLESAMTDDDDEMRVVRGERTGQRELCLVERAPIWVISDRTPNTAPQTRGTTFPGPSTPFML